MTDNMKAKAVNGLHGHALSTTMEFLLNLFADAGIECAIQHILKLWKVVNAPHQSGGLTCSGNSINYTITSPILNEIVYVGLCLCGLKRHILVLKFFWTRVVGDAEFAARFVLVADFAH